MNRLVLIGNGFDLAHGLKTRYEDFINWYWDERLHSLISEHEAVSEDVLCSLSIRPNKEFSTWHELAFFNSFFKNPSRTEWTMSGREFIDELKKQPEYYEITFSPFLENICKSIETRGWVDIEYDYYQLLKECTKSDNCGYTVKELNEQLSFLQEKLVEYLRTIGTNQFNEELHNSMIDFFDPADFSTEGKKKALENMGLENTNLEEIRHNSEDQKKLKPERIMLLSFNYTATAKKYRNSRLDLNYIHGDLEHPDNIIFGYGDELDKDYKEILDRNDNELLKKNKSSRYLLTRHYHIMLEFLKSAPFQVMIMGLSCGNSDRTLLNTVFEHENCVSIKPFYHKWEDGSDTYLELVQNISRSFTNMRLFRDRVVNKEQCETM